MSSRPPQLRVGAVVAFLLTALLSTTLIIWCSVLLLGELIGSHIASMVVIGVVLGIISRVIYTKCLNPFIREVESGVERVQSIFSCLNSGYEWIAKMLFTPTRRD